VQSGFGAGSFCSSGESRGFLSAYGPRSSDSSAGSFRRFISFLHLDCATPCGRFRLVDEGDLELFGACARHLGGNRCFDVVEPSVAEEILPSASAYGADLLRAITDAFSPHHSGPVWVCEMCRAPISKVRLEAVAWICLCRDCKEREQSAA